MQSVAEICVSVVVLARLVPKTATPLSSSLSQTCLPAPVVANIMRQLVSFDHMTNQALDNVCAISS